jgi:hypothetical protein
MQIAKDIRFSTLGSYFGFPECCVKEFTANYCETTRRLYPEGPWMGTGFIPCPCCAPAALEFDQFVANHITPNRRCSTPFPNDDDNGRDCDEVVLAGLSSLPVAQPLRHRLMPNPAARFDAWLLQNVVRLQGLIASNMR